MKLQYLIVHCTDTPGKRPVTRADIEQWHLVENGWSRLGYSDMIHQSGRLQNLTSFDQDSEVDNDEKTWGVAGINSVSRHIVYVGGGDGKDTRTPQQRETLEIYLHYTLLRHLGILIAGHNQFSEKDCPSFNVSKWCRSIGVPEKNIYKEIGV